MAKEPKPCPFFPLSLDCNQESPCEKCGWLNQEICRERIEKLKERMNME